MAFTAIKKGIAVGKDLAGMSKDINSLFDFIDGAKAAQKKGNNSDPLSSYIAYEKAQDFEKQLRDIIIDTRGMRGWDTFQQFRNKAKEQARESKYAEIARRNKIMNIISIVVGIILFGAGVAGLVWFATAFSP